MLAESVDSNDPNEPKLAGTSRDRRKNVPMTKNRGESSKTTHDDEMKTTIPRPIEAVETPLNAQNGSFRLANHGPQDQKPMTFVVKILDKGYEQGHGPRPMQQCVAPDLARHSKRPHGHDLCHHNGQILATLATDLSCQ